VVNDRPPPTRAGPWQADLALQSQKQGAGADRQPVANLTRLATGSATTFATAVTRRSAPACSREPVVRDDPRRPRSWRDHNFNAYALRVFELEPSNAKQLLRAGRVTHALERNGRLVLEAPTVVLRDRATSRSCSRTCEVARPGRPRHVDPAILGCAYEVSSCARRLASSDISSSKSSWLAASLLSQKRLRSVEYG